MNNIKLPKSPLFRDPIYDGAADPTIIWNRNEKSWWILYTNRRANVPCSGVAWCHGTDIGIASSTDGGVNWVYRGIAEGLQFEKGRNTFWAPEVIYNDGVYHMYLSYITGIQTSWVGQRNIIHYTSKDLWQWNFESILDLSSKRVIDACIHKLPSGVWRMWYKDEENNSHTYAADSINLYNWEGVGPIITDCSHEGANVFYFKESYWMITDCWKGLGVYNSKDAINWTRRKNILDTEGARTDDAAYGNHADVLVQGGNAYIFYFTHPQRHINTVVDHTPIDSKWNYEQNRTSIQVAALEFIDGELKCDRDKPFEISLIIEE